jgi:hypothetical protein
VKLSSLKTILSTLAIVVIMSSPLVVLAGAPTSGVLKGIKCATPFAGSVGDGGTATKIEVCGPCDLVLVLVNASDMMVGLSGSIAVLMFVYAGILYLTAGYKPENAGKAKLAATYAITGIVIIFGAYTIVNVVLRTLGGVSNAGNFNQVYTAITGKPLDSWGVCNPDINVDQATGGTATGGTDTTPASTPATEDPVLPFTSVPFKQGMTVPAGSTQTHTVPNTNGELNQTVDCRAACSIGQCENYTLVGDLCTCIGWY